jgi:replicative superfamily II helicase
MSGCNPIFLNAVIAVHTVGKVRQSINHFYVCTLCFRRRNAWRGHGVRSPNSGVSNRTFANGGSSAINNNQDPASVLTKNKGCKLVELDPPEFHGKSEDTGQPCSEFRSEPVNAIVPDIFVPLFPFNAFNHVQTQCRDAFETAKNMVVSAPTGSGKTVLFELAICREIGAALSSRNTLHLGSNELAKKIVYLAPTKALCAEKETEWKQKFSRFGLRVKHLSAEDFEEQKSATAIAETDLILTTPEKWDASTRLEQLRGRELSLVAWTVCLLLIDEVHHVSDKRGAALEAVVARMLVTSDELASRQSSTTRARIRIMAVSATVPNIAEVGEWLRTEIQTGCKSFPASDRPVPLKIRVLGYSRKNQWTFGQYLDTRLMKVIEEYGNNRPALVFCPSRKSTHASATALMERIRSRKSASLQESVFTATMTAENKVILMKMAAQCRTKPNCNLLEYGIAIHHADIAKEDKCLVEDMFRQQLIRVLFTTTTLAQGVNLPAHLVIIKATSVYAGGTMREYDRNMILQMVGRAGRPQYDVSGVAVIMTESGLVKTYEQICEGEHAKVESSLERYLPEYVNAEVARRLIRDVPSAILWFKSTFLYVRKQNTSRGNLNTIQDEGKTMLLNILRELSNSGMLSFDDDGSGLSPRPSGVIMSRLYISFNTMKMFSREAGSLTSPADALKLISRAGELIENTFVRRSEKKKLNDLSKTVRFPLRTRIKSADEKMFILLQLNLGDRVNMLSEDCGLQIEARNASKVSGRVSKSLVSYLFECAEHAFFTSAYSAMQVSRALNANTYWDGQHAFRQVENIGPALEHLVGAGVHSLSTLASMCPRHIEQMLGKNPPYGNQLLSKVQVFPRFDVIVRQKMVSDRQATADTSMYLEIIIERRRWERARTAQTISQFEPSDALNSSPAFILVGSHGDHVLLCRHFRLVVGQKLFYKVAIPNLNPGIFGQWIDIVIGPNHYVGVDFHERVRMSKHNDLAQCKLQLSGVSLSRDHTLNSRRIRGGRVLKHRKSPDQSAMTKGTSLGSPRTQEAPHDLDRRVATKTSQASERDVFRIELHAHEESPGAKRRSYAKSDFASDDTALKKMRLAGTRLSSFVCDDDFLQVFRRPCASQAMKSQEAQHGPSETNLTSITNSAISPGISDNADILELLRDVQSPTYAFLPKAKS